MGKYTGTAVSSVGAGTVDVLGSTGGVTGGFEGRLEAGRLEDLSEDWEVRNGLGCKENAAMGTGT